MESERVSISDSRPNENLYEIEHLFKSLPDSATLSERLYFMSKHPIQTNTNISDAQFPINPFRIFYRFLPNSTEKIQRKWLTYCNKTKRVFCAVCLAFCTKTKFTGAKNNSPFCNSGRSIEVKHIYAKIEKHEKSKLHNDSVLAYKQVQQNKDISSLINFEQKNLRLVQVQERRSFLFRIIEGITFIGRQGIGFRGHRGEAAYSLENRTINHGNILELLLSWSKFDPVLQKYVQIAIQDSKKRHDTVVGHGRGSLVTFLSKTTFDLIIDIIKEKIAEDVKAAKSFSLLMDSSQDISVTDQLAICVHYVLECEIKERLLRIIPIESSKSENLYSTVKSTLKESGLSFKNIVSQAYDGAANFSGVHKGLKMLIKNDVPNSISTHCYSHVLNLALTESASSCLQAVDLFSLLNLLATFFGESYKRMSHWKHALLENTVGSEKLLKLQKIGKTRWWSRETALYHVFEDLSVDNKDRYRFLIVIEALSTIIISKEFEGKVRATALI